MPDEVGESLSDPEAEARAVEIASRTMSPFCPGRTLADCPSGSATEWRQDIRTMLKQGKSPKEIQDILSKRAGANLSGAPESSLGWTLPVGLLAGALILLLVVFRRIKAADETESKKAGADEESADAPSAEPGEEERVLEDRLRRELDETP